MLVYYVIPFIVNNRYLYILYTDSCINVKVRTGIIFFLKFK